MIPKSKKTFQQTYLQCRLRTAKKNAMQECYNKIHKLPRAASIVKSMEKKRTEAEGKRKLLEDCLAASPFVPKKARDCYNQGATVLRQMKELMQEGKPHEKGQA